MDAKWSDSAAMQDHAESAKNAAGTQKWGGVGGRGDSQLHDEVQVVVALVDVLQSDDVLVLYPAA